MDFHSNPLGGLLDMLDKQNMVLGEARARYLSLEAPRKHEEAKLIKRAPGKSHAEKMTNAQAEPEWAELQLNVSKAEAEYEFEKLKFSILEKSWQSSYLDLKLDGSVIKKQD